MDFNDNNFLNEINPLDLNSSIPATRDLKDSIHALAMLNGCTMQEYLEQLTSTEIHHYEIQKLSDYRKHNFYFDARYLKNYNLKGRL